MKSFLVKLGKAWKVLRHDGIGRGGRRVLEALEVSRTLRNVGAGDILYISNGVGDSARYRTRHVAEELNMNGFKASVTWQDNPKLLSYVDQFSVFVFHRVLYNGKIRSLIQAIKKQGKTIIFETDDLVHDPAFLPYMDGYKHMNSLEKKLYENGLSAEIVNDPYVKVATTTTSFLEAELRKKGKKVYRVANKLSREDRMWAEEVLQHLPEKKSGVRICYLSGTLSHNKDFATITTPLLEILEKYKHVRLVLMGPLDTDSVLQRYSSQIERIPFSPRREYLSIIAGMDINMAPLEIGNPFCEAKSENKFIEAGIVKIPTIAAATQTFREAITDGSDGYVALSPEEWREKLEKLILDPELRRSMGEKARETALVRYTTENGKSEEYYNYLRSKIV